MVWLTVNDSVVPVDEDDLKRGPQAISLRCECGRTYRHEHSPQQGDEGVYPWKGEKPFSMQLSPAIDPGTQN